MTLSKNPVISADLLDSCHSFIRGIRDKISTKGSRIVTNNANCTNVRTCAQPPQNMSVFTAISDCVYKIKYKSSVVRDLKKLDTCMTGSAGEQGGKQC